MSNPFQALVVRITGDKNYTRAIEERKIDELPKGEVLIRVQYSSLNYKDILSCVGDRGVTRHYPHTPGIDAAGVVEYCESNKFKAGEAVVVISFGLGANTAGGFGQYIRVPDDWVMRLPEGLSLRESMIYGTAGFTAGLCANALLNHGLTPELGPIVVTGATGGVGCISISLLSGLGFSVTASTGKPDAEKFLKKLGASEVVERKIVNDESGRTILKEVWSGAIDTVGGNTLSTLLKSCRQGGAVAATGLVESSKLPITVFPFIWRGVSLLGIYASGKSMAVRRKIWSKLAQEWKLDKLDNVATECSLEQLSPKIDKMIAGQQIGRLVVDMR